jgi:carbamoyltransferase
MKFIGISGLENAAAFKMARWPHLDERVYGIARGMDAAAALVIDGKLVAAVEQERFNGKKHTGAFPIDAIESCLNQAGVSIHEIDEIAHSFDYRPYRNLYTGDEVLTDLYDKVFSREALLAQMRRELPSFPLTNVHHVSNHLAHAASAAYTSGWDECLVVVNDGRGETESISVFRFSDDKLEKIHAIDANDSIGTLYSLVALHLGFDFNSDEYKVMGLAPYGDPARYRKFFEDAVELCPDGSIRIPILGLNRTCEASENFTATRAYLDRYLAPRRAPGEPIHSNHEDVAAALQECLDRVVLHVCGHFGKATGLRRLAMAGSVALNCTANGNLNRTHLFDEVYVQPVANDAGAALGAALYRASLFQKVPNERFPAPYFGPRYSAGEIESALYRCNGRISWKRYASREETFAAAARLIAEGSIIGWWRGRMEYGPHALGNRSILADPGHAAMLERINAMVKKREAFRPFSAACTVEDAHRWFDTAPGTEFPYMTSMVPVRQEMRQQFPAITSVNGLSRLQTVSVKHNRDFHALLVAVGHTTGRQMVLNTGFNVNGQPIVNTPEEAIVAFLAAGIEHLFLEDFHATRAHG